MSTKNTSSLAGEYAFLTPSTAEEEPEIALTQEQDTVLANIFKQLASQPLAVVRAAAQFANLALTVPSVFSQGVEAVEEYLKASQSQISQPGLFAQVAGGLVTGRSAADFHIHYPGLPLLTLPTGSTGETLLNGKLALRVGLERKVAFYLRPGVLKPGEVTDTAPNGFSSVKFAFQSTAALPREKSATLDMRGLSNPETGKPLTTAELVATKRVVRSVFTGAILLDGALGEVNLGAYSADPPITSPFPAGYAWDAERKYGIIQKWVDSIPATAFKLDLQPKKPVTQAAPSVTEYLQDVLIGKPGDAQSRGGYGESDGEDTRSYTSAADDSPRPYTLGCGQGGHQLLNATVEYLRLYRGTHAENSTHARTMFPDVAASYTAAPKGLTKRVSVLVTNATTSNMPLNHFINEFVVISGIQPLCKACDVAKLIAFCLVKTNLLQVGDAPPHIISQRG